MNTPGSSSVRLFAVFAVVVLGCAQLLPLQAGPKEKVQPLDGTTVAVTDFTEAGRLQPVPSRQAPIYYRGVNAGFHGYTGGGLANDPPPDEKAMLRVIVQVLEEQGFKGADAEHPPTQIIVCSWGTISGGGSLLGPGPGLGFLGGAKMNLIEDQTIPGVISADVFRRRFRIGAADTVYEMSRGDLYAVLLRSYDLAAADDGKIVPLWETRIACSSPGTNLLTALPRIVVSAKLAVGRETAQPMVENVARTRQAWVEIPEIQVIEYIDMADLAKARDEASKPKPVPEKK